MTAAPGRSGVVALLTDFGVQDDFVGLLHAVILSVNPALRIVDLCHHVPPGNVRAGAFLLWHDFQLLPAGSVVAAVVDPGVGSDRALLAADVENRLLVAPDNGLIAPLLEGKKPVRVHRLENREWSRPRPSTTFHGRDWIAPAAAQLASGAALSQAGPAVDRWETVAIAPLEREGGVVGEVLWVDRFGNLVTNLSAADAERRALEIGGTPLRRVATFVEADEGETVWLIGSKGTVEIVCNGASASRALGLGLGAHIRLVAGAT